MLLFRSELKYVHAVSRMEAFGDPSFSKAVTEIHVEQIR